MTPRRVIVRLDTSRGYGRRAEDWHPPAPPHSRLTHPPSWTARHRESRQLLAHLLGGVAVLLAILWAAWELAGGL